MSDILSDLLDDFVKMAESENAQRGLWREQPLSLVDFFRKQLYETPFPGKQTELLETVDLILRKDELPEGDKLKEVTEVVAMWGKGSGKDFLISGIVSYIPYRLNCMFDPQAYFGFGKGEPIDRL